MTQEIMHWKRLKENRRPITNFIQKMEDVWEEDDNTNLKNMINDIFQNCFSINIDERLKEIRESLFLDIYFGIIYRKFLENMFTSENNHKKIELDEDIFTSYSGLYNWASECQRKGKTKKEILEEKLNNYLRNVNPINSNIILPAIIFSVFNTPFNYFHMMEDKAKDFIPEYKRKMVLFTDIGGSFNNINLSILQLYSKYFTDICDYEDDLNNFNLQMQFKYIASVIKDKGSKSRIGTNIDTRINYNLCTFYKKTSDQFENKLYKLYDQFGFENLYRSVRLNDIKFDWEKLKCFANNFYRIDEENNVLNLMRSIKRTSGRSNDSVLLYYFNEMTRLPDLLLSTNRLSILETEIKGFRTKNTIYKLREKILHEQYKKNIRPMSSRDENMSEITYEQYKEYNAFYMSAEYINMINCILAKYIMDIDVIVTKEDYKGMITSLEPLYQSTFDYIIKASTMNKLTPLSVFEFLEFIDSNIN